MRYVFEILDPGASEWSRGEHMFADPMEACRAAYDWLTMCVVNNWFISVRVVQL